MEPACYLLPRWTNWLFPTERSCFSSRSNCSVQERFVVQPTHMSTISFDLLGEQNGIYECTFGLVGEIWKDIFRPQGSLCVCVSPIPLSSPWWNALTMSKYEYGNVGQSVCLRGCMCVCVLVSGQTGGSSLPRWSAGIKGGGGMSVHSMGGTNTHTQTLSQTQTHTRLLWQG